MKKLLPLLLLALLAITCKKEKTCPTCLNGGTCVDGTCSCEPHYTGENCDIQITPTGAFLDNITVTKFLATDANGAGWDLTSGADLYIIVKYDGNVVYDGSSHTFTNGALGSSWRPNLTLSEPRYRDVTVELWDNDDFDADDYIGGVTGKIYSSTGGFPESINFTCGSCDCGFLLSEIAFF